MVVECEGCARSPDQINESRSLACEINGLAAPCLSAPATCLVKKRCADNGLDSLERPSFNLALPRPSPSTRPNPHKSAIRNQAESANRLPAMPTPPSSRTLNPALDRPSLPVPQLSKAPSATPLPPGHVRPDRSDWNRVV